MKVRETGIVYKLALLLGLIGAILLLPLAAQAQQAADPTATPDAEGVIYAEVREDDSLWAIAGRSGIRLETLLSLNGMTENSIIRVGDLLIIGYETPPATATSEPTQTATPLPPPPTNTPPPPPQTAVCLLAFVDQNQNGVQDPGEKLRPAVAFTIYNESAVVANYVTTGVSEPYCLDLGPGTYQITRSSARNEHLTTDGNVAVVLRRGDVLGLAFGGFVGPTVTPSLTPAPVTPTATKVAAPIGGGQAAPTRPAPDIDGNETRNGENGRSASWVSAALFLLIVLMGAGVLFFVVWMRRGRIL